MNRKHVFLALIILLYGATICHAREQLTYTPQTTAPEEIFAYLEKAVQLIQEKGVEAFNELTDPNGPWVEGDWYIYINNFEGYNVAHLNKKIVGKQFFGIRDIKGNAFFAELQKAAMSDTGRGWVEFWWPKPNESLPSRKIGFVIRVPGKKLWVGTGAYDMKEEDIAKLQSHSPVF